LGVTIPKKLDLAGGFRAKLYLYCCWGSVLVKELPGAVGQMGNARDVSSACPSREVEEGRTVLDASLKGWGQHLDGQLLEPFSRS